MTRAGTAMAALSLAAALAGCSAGEPFDDPFAEYGQRIMTVSPSAGSAQAANSAIQTVDPWPRYVYNTRIPGDGARMVSAVQAYEGTGAKAGPSGATANHNTGAINGNSGAINGNAGAINGNSGAMANNGSSGLNSGSSSSPPP